MSPGPRPSTPVRIEAAEIADNECVIFACIFLGTHGARGRRDG